MKVAMVDPSLFTLPYDTELRNALVDRGHEVRLFGRPLRGDEKKTVNGAAAPVDPHFYRWLDGEGWRRAPHSLYLAAKGVNHLWSMTRFLSELERWRPDVVHFQWVPLPAVDRLFLEKVRRIAPIVLTVHDSNPFNGNPSSRLQKIGAHDIFGQFDHLIVHTDAARDRLAGGGLAAARISRIPHGLLPANDPGGERPEAPRTDGTLDLLLFGKIKHYKGVDVLIRAMALLPPAVAARSRVVIAGKPEMPMGEMRQLAADLGVAERVVFDLRFLDADEMPDLFARSTALVFPYRAIDTSGVLLAAMAAGRPIVASRLGTFAELLTDGEHGYLVPPDDPQALADAIARLLRDEEGLRRMGANVRALVDRIPSWRDIAGRTEDVYRGLAA